MGDAVETILIADDEEDLVELLLIMLAQDGRRLLAAHDGATALDITRAELPDLVLSDVMMPGLDGRDLCRRIKSDPATERVSVVLMSAGRVLQPAEYGADAFVPKPFNLLDIVHTVNRLVRSR